MERARALIIICTLIVIVLFILRIYFVIELAMMNFENDAVKAELKEIQNNNTLLKQKLLRETSLIDIERKASLSGFIKPTFYYLK